MPFQALHVEHGSRLFAFAAKANEVLSWKRMRMLVIGRERLGKRMEKAQRGVAERLADLTEWSQ